MSYDVFMVVGIVVGVFAFPALVGAFSEGRPPRTAAIMIMIGGGLIALAVTQSPIKYTLDGIPDVFVRVIGQYFR